MSGGFVTVVLPFLLTENGFSVATTAGIVSVGISANLFRFLWGPVVDITWSLRKWYVIGVVATIISLLVLCFIPFTMKGAALLTIVVFISQVAATLIMLPINGLMAKIVPTEDKGKASGWFQAGNLAGAGLGGGAGLWMATHYSVGAAGLVLCIAFVLCALFIFLLPNVLSNRERLLLHEMKSMVSGILELIKIPIALFVVLLILMPIGTGAMNGLWSAIAQDWQADANTVALVTGLLSGVVSAFGCVAGGYLADRWGVWWTYLGGGIFCALVPFLMGILPFVPAMYIAGVLTYSFTTGIVYAAFTYVLLYAVGKRHVATKFSLLASMGNVPVVYMTAINGWAHDAYSTQFMLISEAGIAILCVLVFAVILRRLMTRDLVPVSME